MVVSKVCAAPGECQGKSLLGETLVMGNPITLPKFFQIVEDAAVTLQPAQTCVILMSDQHVLGRPLLNPLTRQGLSRAPENVLFLTQFKKKKKDNWNCLHIQKFRYDNMYKYSPNGLFGLLKEFDHKHSLTEASLSTNIKNLELQCEFIQWCFQAHTTNMYAVFIYQKILPESKKAESEVIGSENSAFVIYFTELSPLVCLADWKTHSWSPWCYLFWFQQSLITSSHIAQRGQKANLSIPNFREPVKEVVWSTGNRVCLQGIKSPQKVLKLQNNEVSMV